MNEQGKDEARQWIQGQSDAKAQIRRCLRMIMMDDHSAADEKEGGRTIHPNTLVSADVELDKETIVVDLPAPEEALVAKANGALAVDLQQRRSGRKRKTTMSVCDEAASTKNAAVILAEEVTVIPVDNAVTQTLVAVSGGRTRDSALASEALPLVVEEVALQPVAEEVAVSNPHRIEQLSFTRENTKWINSTNQKWMEIKPVIKHQIDNKGFNYGKTNSICAFLRKSLNDDTLSPETVRELTAMNFEWSSYGAYLIVFAVDVVP